MSTPVDLSIAISTRDRPDAVEQCLRALLAAEHVPFEIVVVDQSTTDETQHVVQELAQGPTEIVYVRHDGSGLGASQNLAVRTARREIVAVIDDDCVPGEGWATCIERTFAASPELGLLTGRVLPLGPPTPGLYPVSTRMRTQRRDFSGKAPPWDVGSGNNFAVRREAFLRIGGCDTRLGPGSPGKGGVDMDLFYRLLRAGVRARYEPSVVVYHEQQPLAERMGRRPMYGYGTGACFALWLRQRDAWALPLLAHWLAWRSWRMVAGTARGDRVRAREEAVMIGWTFLGLGYGLRVREPDAALEPRTGD
jgi:GT2 family glycosyltransferase